MEDYDLNVFLVKEINDFSTLTNKEEKKSNSFWSVFTKISSVKSLMKRSIEMINFNNVSNCFSFILNKIIVNYILISSIFGLCVINKLLKLEADTNRLFELGLTLQEVSKLHAKMKYHTKSMNVEQKLKYLKKLQGKYLKILNKSIPILNSLAVLIAGEKLATLFIPIFQLSMVVLLCNQNKEINNIQKDNNIENENIDYKDKIIENSYQYISLLEKQEKEIISVEQDEVLERLGCGQ